jgi:hypothetical protein
MKEDKKKVFIKNFGWQMNEVGLCAQNMPIQIEILVKSCKILYRIL